MNINDDQVGTRSFRVTLFCYLCVALLCYLLSTWMLNQIVKCDFILLLTDLCFIWFAVPDVPQWSPIFELSKCSGRENSHFGLARNLIWHLISPNQDDLSYSSRTFISGQQIG